MRSLTARVALFVMLGTSGIFALLLTFGYFSSRRIILNDAETNARALAESVAHQMNDDLSDVADVTETFAFVLEHTRLDEAGLLLFIRKLVETHQEIFGSTVAFEPYAFDPQVKTFSPYYCKGPSGLKFEQLGKESYDYLNMGWYTEPKKRNASVWSEPYFDEGGGNVVMTTFSVPFYRLDSDVRRKKFRGVATADVSVNWLTERLSSVKILKTGFCFLLSNEGTFLAHPDTKLIMNESIFSLADKTGIPQLRELGKAMPARGSGFVDVGRSLGVRDSFLAFARLPVNGWLLCIVYPKDELFSEVTVLHRTSLLLSAAGLALLLAASLVVGRSVSRPLRTMVRASEQVAAGNLNVDLSAIKRRDEVGRLAEAFVKMASDLKEYIRNLTETTAAKQRIESELAVAARIQRSMLPSKFPGFPEHKEFEIYAVMEPAKEVGGDFYQFFLVNEHQLCFVIGDVSDKGVPAALFMAVTSSLIKAMAHQGSRPDRILTRVNAELIPGNDSCMFVTVFCGILDLRTGEVLYANAGHDAPLLATPDNAITSLDPPDGPALGIMDGIVFKMNRLQMKPGHVLFAFTDGVTESFNPGGEPFSEDRLRKQLVDIRQKTVKEIVDGVRMEMGLFAEGASQNDDITMLALKFTGS